MSDPTPRQPPRPDPEITVERIEVEPMSHEEYQLAVTTLATLINQWRDRR